MVLGEAFHRRAVANLAERLRSDDKQSMLIFDPANLQYLTGMTFVPTDRPVAACITVDGRASLLVPQLEAEHAATGWIRDIRWYHETSLDVSPVQWMAREAQSPLVIDSVTAKDWLEITAVAEDAALSDAVADLRLIKTPAEIELIERAAEFADLALERTFARLTTGSTERDVLADIVAAVDAIMRDQLGDLYPDSGSALTGTIHGGTRAAYPNTTASSRRLARGDSVIVEFIATVGHYKAQAGCTFFVGDPLRDVVRWVEAAMIAQQAAREAMVIGATGEAVDQAARKTFDRLGLGNGLRHRTGQGIGLSTYEPPYLTRGESRELQIGMVLVNQPGAYVAGRTGVRNSETVVIEEEGVRLLNPRIERWNQLESRLKEF